MPSTVNGIGTTYCGKKNRIEHFSVCPHCGCEGRVESYDTTLYFSLLFIPVIPLKKVRVNGHCPTCTRHLSIPLAEWNKGKEKDIPAALANMDAKPHDVLAARQAIDTVASYHDPEPLKPVAERVAARFSKDPDVLVALGYAQAFFHQYPEAEKSYESALRLRGDEKTRECLAEALIQQGRTDEASAFLRHIAESGKKESLGALVQLARAWQAQGKHDKALRMFELCKSIEPALNADDGFRKIVKLSEKNLKSGKPVDNGVIAGVGGPGRAGRAGRASGRDASGSLAKLVFPILAVLIAAIYLVACFDKEKKQEIHLVNGLDRPYEITLDGQTHTLPPLARRPIRHPGGDIVLASADLGLAPTPVSLPANFFLRPFSGPALLLNPDRCAVLVRQKAYYAERVEDAPDTETEFLSGELTLRETGRLLLFEEFPDTVKLSGKGATASRRRIDDLSRYFFDWPVSPLWNMLENNIGREGAVELAKRQLAKGRAPRAALYYLDAHLEADEFAKALEPALDVRPAFVDLHRAYQDAMTKSGKQDEVRERYAALAEADDSSVWKYLHARLVDDKDLKKEILQAGADHPEPSPYCFHALAYEAAREGEFDRALESCRRALEAEPDNPVFKSFFETCLLNARRYGEALERVRARRENNPDDIQAMMDETRLLVLQGDPGAAERNMAGYFAAAKDHLPEETRKAIGMIEPNCRLSFLYFAGRIPEYLAAAEAFDAPVVAFSRSVTARDVAGAEKAYEAMGDGAELWHSMLLYVLARVEKDDVAAERWRVATAEFIRRSPPGRRMLPASVFEGERPAFSEVSELDPGGGKDVAAVAVGLLYPGMEGECLALAERVGNPTFFPSYFLAEVIAARRKATATAGEEEKEEKAIAVKAVEN